MNSKRKPSIGKKINPHYWVFCEGETEEAYIRYLSSEYRLQIEVVPKITGSRIDIRFIQSFKKGKPLHKKDKDFLFYDSDVPEVLKRLKNIRPAILIVSNPSIELWFLLHYKNQVATISEDECIKQLCKRNHNTYKKGLIDLPLKNKLREKCKESCSRAKNLKLYNNPSTTVYVFIEALDNAKRDNSIK